ncbi:MAG: TIGR01244 family phosphatase [Rhodobacteraceae bacterium]|nr:TIGR01244 family phosphatase [Paracoccaceae bacterium]
MEIRIVTPYYAVSPQISAEDVATVKENGFTTIICNRPDAEVPPGQQAHAIGRAVAEAGLAFEVLELTHQTMTPERVARQRVLLDAADGPVLAYCASGTRCAVVWALGYVAELGVDAVLEQARAAGYDLEGLRPTLYSFANQG